MKYAVIAAVVIILSAVLFSLFSKTLVEKIFDEIENNQDYVKGKKLLRLEDFTDFDWDRVHVLYGHMSSETISEVTGVDRTGIVPGDSDYFILVFIKDNHVVYDEIYNSYESSKRVEFYLGDNIYKGRNISRKQCVFKVKKCSGYTIPCFYKLE